MPDVICLKKLTISKQSYNMSKKKITKLDRKTHFRQGSDKRTKIVENSYDDVWYHIGQVKWWNEEVEFYFKEAFRKIFPDLIPCFTWPCSYEWKDGEKVALSQDQTLRKKGLGFLVRILFGYTKQKTNEKVKGYLEPSDDFTQLLETALGSRNWFTHNFQEDEARELINTSEGRQTIIKGLQYDLMPLYELKQYFQALIIYWTRYKGEEPLPLKNDMYEDMLKKYLPKVPEEIGRAHV